jgi:rhamnose utilization protein RhaD (predicted bifunctional aldolase and dehydrogenase)
VHAHPVALVAFSLIGQAPNTRLFHQARTVCGEAGFAPYGLPGSTELGEKISAKFAESYNCVILENHGAAVPDRICNKLFNGLRRSSSVRRRLSRREFWAMSDT